MPAALIGLAFTAAVGCGTDALTVQHAVVGPASPALVSAPTGGTLVSWTAHSGDRVRRGQVLGQIEQPGNGRADVLSPVDGTIVEFAPGNPPVGVLVGAQTPLTQVEDSNAAPVARVSVPGEEARALRQGDQVDLDLEAPDSRHLTGVIGAIPAFSQFSLFPESTPFTPPPPPPTVEVEVNLTLGQELPPAIGALATAHIHR